jgi:phosphoribosyl 1,2-cyclic phosphodiesterase
MTWFVFLGTGGGRFVTLTQTRGTGGLYLHDQGINFHIDPGPGSLVRMKERRINPLKTDAVLLSHSHVDHYADAESIIEGMTQGGREMRGILVGSKSAIVGTSEIGPAISKYHRSLPSKVEVLSPGDKISIGRTSIEATPSMHSDQTTVGFKISTKKGIISYVTDTKYFDSLPYAHRGARILVLCVIRPSNARIPFHLCTEDAALIIDKVKPELAIITHFGMKLLREGPWKQARWISEKTGVKTWAAEDGMRIKLAEDIKIERDFVKS